MRKNDYQPLGKYIEQVNVRNRDLTVTNLMGVSIEKRFIPSIANTIGTDLSPYKIVKPGQFAYGPVTSRNGDKITIALYNGNEDCIISQAYEAFRIKDTTQLLPEYLMMWAKRPEFDRYARYMSHGSVRELFSWEEMCNVKLPVPPIEEQRRIVSEYQTVERRIANNEALIQKLEETAQAIYHHTFVEGIDEENLPEGWRKGCFSEVMNISSGKSVIDKVEFYDSTHPYPVAGASGVIGYSSNYNRESKILTTGRVGTLGVINKYNSMIWAADNVLIVESKYYEYAYNLLCNVNFGEIAKGGVQALLTQTELNNYGVIIPPKNILESFENNVAPIYSYIEKVKEENTHLRTLLSLLTSKLS